MVPAGKKNSSSGLRMISRSSKQALEFDGCGKVPVKWIILDLYFTWIVFPQSLFSDDSN